MRGKNACSMMHQLRVFQRATAYPLDCRDRRERPEADHRLTESSRWLCWSFVVAEAVRGKRQPNGSASTSQTLSQAPFQRLATLRSAQVPSKQELRLEPSRHPIFAKASALEERQTERPSSSPTPETRPERKSGVHIKKEHQPRRDDTLQPITQGRVPFSTLPRPRFSSSLASHQKK
jgi:hypothetical protein